MRTVAFIMMVALAACGAPKSSAKPAGPPPAAASALAGPSDPAAKLAASSVPLETQDFNKELSVDQVERIEAGGKIFSTVGGDPAINGVYTFLAIPVESSDGPELSWKVFKIGDFNSWQLVDQDRARVVLKVSHSVYDNATASVRTAEQKIAVALPGPDAKSVAITPLD